jgi:hypothetical protein
VLQKNANLVAELAENCFSQHASIKKKKFVDLRKYSEIFYKILGVYGESDQALA